MGQQAVKVVLVCLSGFLAFGLRGEVRADECETRAAQVIASTGVTSDRRSPSGETIFFKHPEFHATLYCGRFAAFSAIAEARLPPARFLSFVGRGGRAVATASADAIAGAAASCQAKALSDEGAPVRVVISGAQVNCNINQGSGALFVEVASSRNASLRGGAKGGERP